MIRKAYMKKVTDSLKSLAEDIDLLKDRAGHAGEAIGSRYADELEAIRALERNAHRKVVELSEAADPHWGKFKAGVDHAVDDLRKALNDATERIRRAVSGMR
jgi:uncharacterized coiled-coil DUF342 family protein